MQFINLEEYKAVVEHYIYEKTNRKVKIVFDDPYRLHLHFKLLCAAYDHVIQKQK